MQQKESKTRRASRNVSLTAVKPLIQEDTQQETLALSSNSVKTRQPKWLWVLVPIVLVIIGLGIYKKNLIVAATVNGSLISNLELQTRLNQEYRLRTLEAMIAEKIILQEARKNNVSVSDSDVDQEINKIQESVGGLETLKMLLGQQGQSLESLKSQLKVELTAQKLFSRGAIVSEEEIDKFIKENGSLLAATDSAKKREEAAKALTQQKTNEILSQKFQELKGAAKINIF